MLFEGTEAGLPGRTYDQAFNKLAHPRSSPCILPKEPELLSACAYVYEGCERISQSRLVGAADAKSLSFLRCSADLPGLCSVGSKHGC